MKRNKKSPYLIALYVILYIICMIWLFSVIPYWTQIALCIFNIFVVAYLIDNYKNSNSGKREIPYQCPYAHGTFQCIDIDPNGVLSPNCTKCKHKNHNQNGKTKTNKT